LAPIGPEDPIDEIRQSGPEPGRFLGI